MYRTYSNRLKSQMVKRMVGPNAVSAMALADEVGIHHSTLSRWLENHGSVDSMAQRRTNDKAGAGASPAPIRQKRPEDWTPREKLQAVMEASQLDDAALGEWLRRRGLHATHLQQWRNAVTSGAEEALAGSKAKRSTTEGKRIKELERELKRKDAALAETAALLVLRKKANALWGDEDASTGLTSDDESSR
jgi:transposase